MFVLDSVNTHHDIDSEARFELEPTGLEDCLSTTFDTFTVRAGVSKLHSPAAEWRDGGLVTFTVRDSENVKELIIVCRH